MSTRRTIERWVGDYCASAAFLDRPSPVPEEEAAPLLVAFLAEACAHRGVEPADIEPPDMKPALLGGVAPLGLSDAARDGATALCEAFLGALQDEGRLSGGRQLGQYVRALREPFLRAAAGVAEPLSGPRSAPGAPLGRNDPCPCGSGKKYKKCCLGRLG